MNRNDTLAFCTAAELLLAAHSNDDQITGRARENAQREFARNAYPTLELAIDKIRELIAEVSALRTGVNESEGALLRIFAEVQTENKRLRERMPCGHPRACLVSSDDERDSTVSCAWCTDRARLQEVDAANRQLAVTGMRLASGLAESKHRVIELEAEAQLNAAMLAQQCDLARDAETALARERMRATVGGTSVL